MRIFQRHLHSPGVRLQLTLWYILVFALLLIISDIIFYEQLHSSLSNNLNAALQLHAQQIAVGISNENGHVRIQNVNGDIPGTGIDTGPNVNVTNQSDTQSSDVEFGSLVRILDARGKTLRVTPAFQMLLVPATSVTQALQETSWQGTITTRSGQQVRLYSMALMDNNTPFAVIQVGESLAQLNTTLQNVLIELLLTVPFVLLLGALGSYWLAGRAFIPVDRLTRTAQQIKAGDLHQRVPVPRSHDEIQRLALTLNEMIERLEQTFTRQRRFVADASHELRTPVAAIRSMTELAQLQQLSQEEYNKMLHDINVESERLGHLISDLLALARADEGQTRLECAPVRLDVLSHAVAANAEPLALEHDVTVQVEAPVSVVVMGDEARLIQAVMNLLDNAIIYTNAGGQVTLTVETKQQQAYLRVHDTGIGIAPEHLPHLFERFYRVDQARVRTEGNSSGLGLAIVDWVIHAHGGTISIESQVGKGSTFTITLPLAPDSSMQPSTPIQLKVDEIALPHH